MTSTSKPARSFHERYVLWFYEDVDVLEYPWVYHDRYEHYLPKKKRGDFKGHARTGSFDYANFERLKEDIREHGVLHPFIIEYYDKDLPNAGGLQGFKSLAIRTGNNRAEAMRQLGVRRAAALFVVPVEQEGLLPVGVRERIAVDRKLESRLQKLWREARARNGDLRWAAGAWRDSSLLVDIIRSFNGEYGNRQSR